MDPFELNQKYPGVPTSHFATTYNSQERSDCICLNPFCYWQRTLDNEIYSNKIQISKVATQTTLEDLRIRFSVYGSIKDCYFFSHQITNKYAYITFDEKYSAIKAAAGSENIYLHGQSLQVCKMMKELTDLNIDPGNTLHINNLIDDCLLEIFEYLSIIERLKLKRVCKRWRTIAKVSLRTIKNLDLQIWNIDNFEHCDDENQFTQLLEELAKLNLPQERSLSFYQMHNSKIIASLNMHLLAMRYKNLTKLIIRCSTYDEHILSRILEKTKELRYIKIVYNRHISGEALIQLSEKIHTLIISHCSSLKSNHLCAALKRLKNLKYLELTEINIAWDVVNIFDKYCKNLEIFKLKEMSVPENRQSLNIFLPVTSLTNLRELKMSVNDHITLETFVVNLCHNCQELRKLELYSYTGNMWHISKRAMSAITTLTKLKKLSIHTTGLELANLHGLTKHQ